MKRVSASDPAYCGLRDQLIESTGLTFRAGRENELVEFIGQRLSDLNMPDCSAYVRLLANGTGSQAEMDVVIERFAIGETYFFRDPEQFAAIRDVIIPDVMQRKQASRQLRIWSAGCASGAEPYSLAILLMHEMALQLAGWQVSIKATDLNRNSLTRAATGEYREWALRGTRNDVRSDCFSNKGRLWTIHPRYKKWISFHHMNLVSGGFSAPWPAETTFDLILCRNVMIYFTPEVNRGLIGKLRGSLAEGGWLVVGGAEHNPEAFQAFRTVITNGAMVYQKTVYQEPAPADETPSAPEADQTPPVPEAQMMRPEKAAPLADIPVPRSSDDLGPLAEPGIWQEAVENCQKLLLQDRMNPAIHFELSVIFEKLGIADDSERSLRQAIYLDRNFAMAHYRLGLLLEKNGQISPAARSFRNVLKILTGVKDDAFVSSGDGVTATGLRELTRSHLEIASGL